MKAIISRLISANRVILANASSLMSTSIVSSVLGFAYWWVAARMASQHNVGVASASISTMQLLGNIGVLGLSTLLVSEIPRDPDDAPALITTALYVSGLTSIILGVAFALLAPQISADLGSLSANWLTVVLFAVGVSLTAMNIVLDQATIGLLKGKLQLGRNTFFAVAKLVLLGLAGFVLSARTSNTIYAVWAISAGLSLGLLVYWLRKHTAGSSISYAPRWSLLRHLGPAAMSHHALNLTLQGPRQLLPLLVTGVLSAATNAHFYVALMIANFIYMGPISLTTVLHAVGMVDREKLTRKLRSTFGMSMAIGLAANVVVLVGAGLIMRIFGPSYSEAQDCLRLLALAVFPVIIRYHYVSLMRINGTVFRAAIWLSLGGLLELGLAAFGAYNGGLTGLALGWLIAMCVEGAFMAIPLYRLAFADLPRGWLKHYVTAFSTNQGAD